MQTANVLLLAQELLNFKMVMAEHQIKYGIHGCAGLHIHKVNPVSKGGRQVINNKDNKCSVVHSSPNLCDPMACGILAPRAEIQRAFPTLEGKVLTTGPLGKSQVYNI